MRQRFDFVAPTGTPESELLDATHSMAGIQKRENVFQEEELEKTPGERAAIDLFDDILKQEFLELGILEVPELRPERFHIMSEAWFQKYKTPDNFGSFRSFHDKITVSRDRAESLVQLYTTILHEAVHSVSMLKNRLDVNQKSITTYRIGYDVQNTFDEKNIHDHFIGFNEGVVELTAEEIFEKWGDEIGKRLNLSQGDIEDVQFQYSDSRSVVRALCQGLGDAQEVGPQAIWDKIKRGQFTGEMMHLRDIERTYGKGSLRVLDALEISSDDLTKQEKEQNEQSRKNNLIRLYFESYDREGKSFETVRSRYAIAILGLEDYRKYCQ